MDSVFLVTFFSNIDEKICFLLTAGDVYEAEVRADEEGLRVERVV